MRKCGIPPQLNWNWNWFVNFMQCFRKIQAKPWFPLWNNKAIEWPFACLAVYPQPYNLFSIYMYLWYLINSDHHAIIRLWLLAYAILNLYIKRQNGNEVYVPRILYELREKSKENTHTHTQIMWHTNFGWVRVYLWYNI